jgi:hypothetical protein
MWELFFWQTLKKLWKTEHHNMRVNTTRRTQDNKYIYLLPRLVLGGTEGMGARAVPTFSWVWLAVQSLLRKRD